MSDPNHGRHAERRLGIDIRTAASTWTVILAAGAGRRLAAVTGGIPKQFWRAGSAPSLLEDTLGRLGPLAAPSRTVTVVDRSHRPYVVTHRLHDRVEHVLYQPQDRGTAAGVFLGLTAPLEASADAIVVVTPSDHGVTSASAFRATIRCAIEDVRRNETAAVVLGVVPDQPASDYGWIAPAEVVRAGHRVRIADFVEKPDPARAERLFRAGAVWSSMVIVARAGALADLYRRHLPDLAQAFDAALRHQGWAREYFLDTVYPTLPRADFSADLLSRARDTLSLRTWPSSMGWSDLGTPERLLAWRAHRSSAPCSTASAA